MTNVYMKDSLKRITAVILLAAATLLVALQCGSIAKKEEAAALLRADASSSCNKMPPDGFFRESVESPKAAVDNKINASENAGIDVKNELTALFTDLYGLVGDVLSGNDADTGELEVRFKNIFDGLFKLDADTVKTDPTADGVLKNDGFVASAAEVLWNYMDYYDTNRLKKQTESAGVTVKKDIPYISDGNKYHLLDIYYPENAAEKLPVIIDIHGGGLMYAEKEVNRVYASRLAKRGYIVVCINYSLCPDVTYPTQVSDVMASYRWVAENGENFGFDLDRVFVAGDSAGGQLAFYTAAVNTSDELKSLYGISDTGLNIKAIGLISGMFDMKNGVNSALLSCYLGYDYKNSPYYPYLQPEEIIDKSDIPPAYIVTSVKDFLHSASDDLDKLLTEKGKEHMYHDWQLTVNRSSGHITSVAYPDLPESAETIDEMLAFFEAHS